MQKIQRKLSLDASDVRGARPAPVMPELTYPWAIREVRPQSSEVGIVHNWMQQDHVKLVMRKDWPLDEWQKEIQEQWDDSFSRPYIVSYGGVDGGYIELYRVERDVIASAVDGVEPHAIGMHGAIGELAGLNAGYAVKFWIELLAGIFRSDAQCNSVYSDPAADNPIVRALNNRVCEITGGRNIGDVQLPHKLANLYCFDRTAYFRCVSQ